MSILLFLLAFSAVSNATIISRFDDWLTEHNIRFLNENERTHIFNNWASNDAFIEFTNKQHLSYTLGHNAYSGMDSNEFSNLMEFSNNRYLIRENLFNNDSYTNIISDYSLPLSVDWRTQGVVNPIRDQGQCGSCWSFSTIQSVESASAIKYGKLLQLSEQQLVDCDNFKNGGSDHGCSGGLMDNAFTWIGKNDGSCSSTDYPYVSGSTMTAGSCQKCTVESNTKVAKFIDIVASSDASMMTAISMQPVSIAIEADQRAFQLYSSGVFDESCGANLDHGVGLVGYGSTEDGKDYYILRNSWGTTWGDKGYMYLARGSSFNGGQGQCGALLMGSYPVIA
jgi:C1A family cysteine protease